MQFNWNMNNKENNGMLRIFILSFILITSGIIYGLTADDLCELDGFTLIDCTNVSGEFEGADYDKLVELDNGLIFRFTEYKYSYSYHPACAIFARSFTYQEKDVVLYYLVIDEEVYSVTRVL
jgi:hypothetical protein